MDALPKIVFRVSAPAPAPGGAETLSSPGTVGRAWCGLSVLTKGGHMQLLRNGVGRQDRQTRPRTRRHDIARPATEGASGTRARRRCRVSRTW